MKVVNGQRDVAGLVLSLFFLEKKSNPIRQGQSGKKENYEQRLYFLAVFVIREADSSETRSLARFRLPTLTLAVYSIFYKTESQ